MRLPVVNSGPFDGMSVADAKRRSPYLAAQGHGQAVVNYRLHDWCISRQRYWGPPIPIIYCDACGTVPVPESQLPVVLPFIPDFKPDDSGVSPLARHEEWYRVACPSCGKPRDARPMCRTRSSTARGISCGIRAPRARRAVRCGSTKKWLPVTTYIGGNEHAVLHLLYSRFITMVLHDMPGTSTSKSRSRGSARTA
jgi:leucyl-tRNA synthetase